MNQGRRPCWRLLLQRQPWGNHSQANREWFPLAEFANDAMGPSGILPREFVEIWSTNSGARISTYVILGERGPRCCILNGAAARTCQPGDQVIICNSIYLDESRITSIKLEVLTFDQDAHVRDRLS